MKPYFRKIIFLLSFVTAAIPSLSQTFNEWQNPAVNEINRLPMHTNHFAFETVDAAKNNNRCASSNYLTLNGIWNSIVEINLMISSMLELFGMSKLPDRIFALGFVSLNFFIKSSLFSMTDKR